MTAGPHEPHCTETDAALRRALVCLAFVGVGIGFFTDVGSLIAGAISESKGTSWTLILVLNSLVVSLLRFVAAYTFPDRKNLADIVIDFASNLRRPKE